MLVTAHQPNYLPYPAFFDKMARADLLVILDNVQYVKRGQFGWINRNRIRMDDTWMWLTVPVETKGKRYQPIRDVKTVEGDLWPQKHWKSIQYQYRKAPHFDRYADDLARIYQEQCWDNLLDVNLATIRLIAAALDIATPISLASELGVDGRASELLGNICRATGADGYLSGMHGRDYLAPDVFRDADLSLEFQNFGPLEYPQHHGGDFVENLSTIDLLMNCGPDSRGHLDGAGASGSTAL